MSTEIPSLGRKVYEGALWMPWIQKRTLHKPADAFYRTTQCGMFVGKDKRARTTDAHRDDSRFDLCPKCFPHAATDEAEEEA